MPLQILTALGVCLVFKPTRIYGTFGVVALSYLYPTFGLLVIGAAGGLYFTHNKKRP